jgi:WD40 repeat protein
MTGQSISAFNCINTFKSRKTKSRICNDKLDLAFCGGSNKTVEIFDIAYEKSVRNMVDAHTRAVHTIHLHEKSPYISHTKEMHDLFLTSSTDGNIKLWDLRADKFVRGEFSRLHVDV